MHASIISGAIRERRKHARFLVVHVVAVKHPLTRIVSVELDCDFLLWFHNQCVFARTSWHREAVAVEMHRMPHRGLILKDQSYAFTSAHR